MTKYLTWTLIALAGMTVCPASGTDQPAVLNHIGSIRISADSLTVPGGTENHAEFRGNVHAVGDRFDITADQLKIFYQLSSEKSGDDIASGKTLTRIIATGNVVITSGEKIAKTEEAVYDKDQQTIILTGEKSMVLQNNSYISGKKIIMHMDSEAVTVESGAGNRVEAFIETQDIQKNH
jgi:lipopolysaccharide export system protein LptA